MKAPPLQSWPPRGAERAEPGGPARAARPSQLRLQSQTRQHRAGGELGHGTCTTAPLPASLLRIFRVTGFLFQGPSAQYPRLKIKPVSPRAFIESGARRGRTSHGPPPPSLVSCLLSDKQLNLSELLRARADRLKQGRTCKAPEATDCRCAPPATCRFKLQQEHGVSLQQTKHEDSFPWSYLRDIFSFHISKCR